MKVIKWIATGDNSCDGCIYYAFDQRARCKRPEEQESCIRKVKNFIHTGIYVDSSTLTPVSKGYVVIPELGENDGN